MEICWNLTHCCPFSCKICMVNPVNVNDDNKLIIRSRLEKSGKCLTHYDKIKIIKEIASSFGKVKIDFAGGDPLLFKEDFEIIKLASNFFGAENIEISATGYPINKKILNFLKDKVSKLDFTLDTVFPRLESSRGDRYSKINTKAIILTRKKGLEVTVSTVLKKDNIDKKNLNEIYHFLLKNRIANWHLMRFRPLGRGSKYKSLMPSEKEYKEALNYCLSLKRKNGPIINIHHTFYNLMNIMSKNKACKIGNKFTILSDGTVISCCWAFNRWGRPLDDKFVLGKLPQDNLEEIIKSDKLKKIKKIPACRVDYFLNNTKK